MNIYCHDCDLRPVIALKDCLVGFRPGAPDPSEGWSWSARGRGGVFPDELAEKADQDRRRGGQPWPLRHVRNGRGRDVGKALTEILMLIARLRAAPAPPAPA